MQKLLSFTKKIIQIHNIMIYSALTTGIPLDRWVVSDVIMIEKNKNNSYINWLQVIIKIEAGNNFIL